MQVDYDRTPSYNNSHCLTAQIAFNETHDRLHQMHIIKLDLMHMARGCLHYSFCF